MTLTVSVTDIVRESNNPLLGKHPSWDRIELGSVATILNGFPFDSSLFSRSEGFPLLRIRDILKGSTETFFDGKFDPKYVVEPGDLVIGMDGDFNCARWRGPRSLLNQRVCKVSVQTDQYDARFLDFVLPGYLKAINDATSSLTVKHLSSRSIAEIPLPFPPIEEQREIAAKLDELTTKIDAGVASLRRVQSALKRYRAAVLKAACEGRLVPQDPNDEPAAHLLERILAERRARWAADLRARGKDPAKAKYEEPKGPETAGLPALPEGWCWATAEQLCDFITKGTTPSGEKLLSGNGEIPFIKVYNLTNDGWLDFSVKPTFVDRATHSGELARSKVCAGDVLMNIVGPPLGKVSVVPDRYPEWNINQAIAVFRPMPSFSGPFLSLCLLTESILNWAVRRAKATAGQFNLTLEICRRLPIPVPPLSEQHRIVTEYERRRSLMQHVEVTSIMQLSRAERLRQAVLRRAFEGKVLSSAMLDIA